jgi:hypothetical protein
MQHATIILKTSGQSNAMECTGGIRVGAELSYFDRSSKRTDAIISQATQQKQALSMKDSAKIAKITDIRRKSFSIDLVLSEIAISKTALKALLRQRRTVLLKGRGNAIKQQSETLRT